MPRGCRSVHSLMISMKLYAKEEKPRTVSKPPKADRSKGDIALRAGKSVRRANLWS